MRRMKINIFFRILGKEVINWERFRNYGNTCSGGIGIESREEVITSGVWEMRRIEGE